MSHHKVAKCDLKKYLDRVREKAALSLLGEVP